MLIGEKRSLGGATIFCTPLMKQAIRVKLPLANDGKTRIQEWRAFDLSRPKKILLFGEDGRLRRVDIFRCLFIAAQRPGAKLKADHPALLVADGNINRPRKRS